MNKWILAGVVGMLASGGSALAGTVTIGWAANHSPSGGEFVLTTSNDGTFNSFCIEHNENVSIGGTYSYVLNPAGAVGGGLTGGNPDPVSIGSALLYREFRDGTLPGYSSGNSGNQNDLQNAIWWLEGELGVAANDPSYNYASNPYLIHAKSALGYANFSDLQANGNGWFGVIAMNIGSGNQDMLYLPDGGTTVMLLGVGLGGLALVNRRRA